MPHKKYIVAANWKMNILPSSAKPLVSEILFSYVRNNADVIICPPYTHLSNVSANTIIAGFYLGAQNISEHISGAFTGEISADMIMDLGCTHVIIGHSERRELNPRENESIAAKIKMALSKNLRVIYCCGENLDIRNAGREKSFVLDQLIKDLYSLENLDSVIIAYEPIWAIGTGKTATAQQANEMHQFIKENLSVRFPSNSASLKILYGGSVKSNNARELMEQEYIDGVLVGGASLNATEFIAIIDAFNN